MIIRTLAHFYFALVWNLFAKYRKCWAQAPRWCSQNRRRRIWSLLLHLMRLPLSMLLESLLNAIIGMVNILQRWQRVFEATSLPQKAPRHHFHTAPQCWVTIRLLYLLGIITLELLTLRLLHHHHFGCQLLWRENASRNGFWQRALLRLRQRRKISIQMRCE